jgi:hypothetical protein
MTFSELISLEEAVLCRLLLASEKQLELARGGNITLLIRHLGQRERLWHEFEQLEQQLAEHKGILPERRLWTSAEERQMTEAALNRCKELMEKILANDQMSSDTVAEQKQYVEAQIQKVGTTRRVAPEYVRQSKLDNRTA